MKDITAQVLVYVKSVSLTDIGLCQEELLPLKYTKFDHSQDYY